jgi:hypothetical protein
LQDGASISLDPACAFDIDTVTDLQLAEAAAHV